MNEKLLTQKQVAKRLQVTERDRLWLAAAR